MYSRGLHKWNNAEAVDDQTVIQIDRSTRGKVDERIFAYCLRCCRHSFQDLPLLEQGINFDFSPSVAALR